MKHLEQELENLEKVGLLRELHTLPHGGGKINIEGQVFYNLACNDYLDLAHHPLVKTGGIEAIRSAGAGAAASRLMAGHFSLHEVLEQRLAALVGTEEALVFGSGFLANLGVLQALANEDDCILCDKLNHASLIDGMRHSGARWYRYRHKDMNHLETLLKRNYKQKYIVTDSVFSMDGDRAPLAELVGLAEKYEATLIVDEAHAIGVLGEHGGGLSRTLPPERRPAVITGTLSKALGSYGGFVGCSTKLRHFLLNKARSFIYSTALPPACLGSALAALDVLSATPAMGNLLMDRVNFFYEHLIKTGLSLRPLESQIIPLVIGDVYKTVQLARDLRTERIIATAIRPPTVPAGTARLRLSITLAHTPEDLAYIATTLGKAAQRAGLI